MVKGEKDSDHAPTLKLQRKAKATENATKKKHKIIISVESQARNGANQNQAKISKVKRNQNPNPSKGTRRKQGKREKSSPPSRTSTSRKILSRSLGNDGVLSIHGNILEYAQASPQLTNYTNSQTSKKETPHSLGVSIRKPIISTHERIRRKELQKRTLKAVGDRKNIQDVPRGNRRPLPGLQELRRPVSRQSQEERRESTNKLHVSSSEQQEDRDEKKGSIIRTTSSKSTANALKVVEDATGFVRAALIAVSKGTVKNDVSSQPCLVKKSVVDINVDDAIQVDSNQNVDSISSEKLLTRKVRRKRKMTTEKLVQELDSSCQPSNHGDTDMKEKLRQGINRLTRSQSRLLKREGKSGSSSVLDLGTTCTKLPRVANRENLPKATASALVRRLKSDIEDHAKKYGLLDHDKDVSISKKGGEGFEQSACNIGPVDELKHQTDWTPEQEIALQNAYVTIKPATDFWYHISKRVAGKTPEECFHKFYEGPFSCLKRKRPVDKTITDKKTLCIVKAKGKSFKGKLRVSEAQRTLQSILERHQAEEEVKNRNNRTDKADNKLEARGPFKRFPEQKTSLASSDVNRSHSTFEILVIGGLVVDDQRNIFMDDQKNRVSVRSTQQDSSYSQELKQINTLAQPDTLKDPPHQRHQQTRRVRLGSQKLGKKGEGQLQSKELVEFGENTLSAIRHAKEELRNVFLKLGGTGTEHLEAANIVEENGDREGESEDSNDE